MVHQEDCFCGCGIFVNSQHDSQQEEIQMVCLFQ